jgi:hypothetical protein
LATAIKTSWMSAGSTFASLARLITSMRLQ